MAEQKLKNQMWYYTIEAIVILLATPTIEGLLVHWFPFMIGPILSWIVRFAALVIVLIPTDMITRRFLKV